MNWRIDNKVCVPHMLRTDVPIFEKEVEPAPPPKEEGKEYNPEAQVEDQGGLVVGGPLCHV